MSLSQLMSLSARAFHTRSLLILSLGASLLMSLSARAFQRMPRTHTRSLLILSLGASLLISLSRRFSAYLSLSALLC